MKTDIYKQFSLEAPIGGLVKKVTSPKGLRTPKGDDYVYKLKTDICGISGEALSLEEGLYHVLDICKPYDHVIWNHYLFIVEADGLVYPVAEYLDQTDSMWVKQAIKAVKEYFAGESFMPIQLTKYDHEAVKTTRWKR